MTKFLLNEDGDDEDAPICDCGSADCPICGSDSAEDGEDDDDKSMDF